MGLALLKSNLQEIFCAVHQIEHKKLSLVADPIWGTTLYVSTAGFGRIWTFFYDVAKWFGYEELQARQFKNAMSNTFRMFLEEQRKVNVAVGAYKEYVKGKSQGEHVDVASAIRARHLICQWHDATAQFVALRKKEGRLPLLQQISRVFRRGVFSSFRAFKSVEKLVALEGALQKEIPYRELLKMAKNIPLEVGGESKIFENFVTEVSKPQREIGIRALDKALYAIVEIFKENASIAEAVDLGILEKGLFEKGCRHFVQSDMRHIEKRKKFFYGEKIACNGKWFFVGTSLEQQFSKHFDCVHLYTLLNSSHLLAIGPNRAFYRLQKEISKVYGWGIPLMEIVDIEEHGHFALIHRLEASLLAYPWKSGPESVDGTDCAVLTPVAEFLKWCVKQEKSPYSLFAHNLMFNRFGELRALKILFAVPFDFNSMADFVFEVAAGNRIVYRFLMERSGLQNHPCAQFYLDVALKTLRGEEFSVKNVAAASQIVSHSVVKRGAQLKQKVLSLKERCREVLAFKVPKVDGEKVLASILISMHCYFSAGFVPSFVEKELLKKIH